MVRGTALPGGIESSAAWTDRKLPLPSCATTISAGGAAGGPSANNATIGKGAIMIGKTTWLERSMPIEPQKGPGIGHYGPLDQMENHRSSGALRPVRRA